MNIKAIQNRINRYQRLLAIAKRQLRMATKSKQNEQKKKLQLAELLENIRWELRLSKTEYADKLNISRQMYNEYLTGKLRLRKVADLLNKARKLK